MSGQDTPRDQAQDGPAVARSMPPAAPVPARPMWPAQQSAGPVLGALPPPASAPEPAPQPQVQPAERTAVEPAPGGAPDTAATSKIVGETGGTLLLAPTGNAGGVTQSTTATQGSSAGARTPSATGTLVPPDPGHGTVYGGGYGPGEDQSRLIGRVRPLPPLRIGSHLASDAALDEIGFGMPAVGMLLGHDRDRKPVQIRTFRPEPTRLTFVGGLWGARLLAFRALALGARVVVFSRRPEHWNGFGQWATGRSDRMAVMPEERPVTVASNSLRPALLIYDMGLLGAARRPDLGPWQTQLTVLHQLTAYGFPAVQESNLVMLQRLGKEESYSLGSVLRLDGSAIQLLTALRDDMFALVGGGADRYVWVTPTSVEQQRFGAPSRR